MSTLLSCSEVRNIENSGKLIALIGVREEIDTIVAELERKGIEEPKGFSILKGYVTDRLRELN